MTLLEVLLAIAVFFFAGLILLQSVTAGSLFLIKSKELVILNKLAQRRVEEIRAVSSTSGVTASSGDFADYGFPNFRWELSIPTTSPVVEGIPMTNLTQISLVVRGPYKPGTSQLEPRGRSVTVSSYLAREPYDRDGSTPNKSIRFAPQSQTCADILTVAPASLPPVGCGP